MKIIQIHSVERGDGHNCETVSGGLGMCPLCLSAPANRFFYEMVEYDTRYVVRGGESIMCHSCFEKTYGSDE
jgi:hypothetical protein